MFIATQTELGAPKTFMNVSVGNGLFFVLITVSLWVAGLSGTGTTEFTAPNIDRERPAVSMPSATDARVPRSSTAPAPASFGANANETPRWRSDIMDSYESVPSLAALAKPRDARR